MASKENINVINETDFSFSEKNQVLIVDYRLPIKDNR